jgi:hypothetical protein
VAWPWASVSRLSAWRLSFATTVAQQGDAPIVRFITAVMVPLEGTESRFPSPSTISVAWTPRFD